MNLPDWARAHGDPLFKAAIRTTVEDFQVTEQLGWALSGDGEHDYLWVEKTGANTEWVARQLASFAGVPAKDVGFAGLKDRHAVTRQWFSVPRWNAPEWERCSVEGVRIASVGRHLRKLRRGAHKGNEFRIVLRAEQAIDGESLQARVDRIATLGVPNYFGEQRFGRNGNNLLLADDWANGKRLPRAKRGIAISTIRSFVFNEALSSRVQQNTWHTLVAGDRANLEGSGSVFDVAEIDETLQVRCAEMDLHPAGLLAGDGSDIEPEHWQQALSRARVEPGDRSLRLKVDGFSFERSGDNVLLAFTLGRGAFATSVLRELCQWRQVAGSSLAGDSSQ